MGTVDVGKALGFQELDGIFFDLVFGDFAHRSTFISPDISFGRRVSL